MFILLIYDLINLSVSVVITIFGLVDASQIAALPGKSLSSCHTWVLFYLVSRQDVPVNNVP